MSDKGFFFKQFEPKSISPFDKLFDIFKELIVHVSGDFDEAIAWLRELDKEYELTDENYTVDDFVAELQERGYIRPVVDGDGVPGMGLTAKTEQQIRQTAHGGNALVRFWRRFGQNFPHGKHQKGPNQPRGRRFSAERGGPRGGGQSVQRPNEHGADD